MAAGVLCAAAGCRHVTGGRADRGTEMYGALQSAAARAVDEISASVVHIVPVPSKPGGDQQLPNSMLRRSSAVRLRPAAGVVMSRQGYILMPGVLEPDAVERLTVWVGDVEHQAGIVKADEQLGMTMIKINPDDELVPISFEKMADLQAGSRCVSLWQGGEELDFARFLTPGFCRGVVAARYRTFDVNGAYKSDAGAPVVDMDGALVGFAASDNIVSITDMHEDLLDFFNEASGVTSPDEAARRKGWLGIMMQPVNKNYARKHGLPRSGLWVTHAISNAPAIKAGIRTGDLIVGLNGEPLRLSGARAQSYFLQSLRPRAEREFEITVLRDGRSVVCKGVFEKQPEEEKFRARDIGIEVKAITDIDRFARNLFTAEGVLVTEVEAGSAAATSSTFRSGLLRNDDVILEVDGRPTPTLDEFKRVLGEVRSRRPDVLLVYFQRGRYNGYAGLNLKIGDNAGGGEL